jgi:hypothetical protein
MTSASWPALTLGRGAFPISIVLQHDSPSARAAAAQILFRAPPSSRTSLLSANFIIPSWIAPGQFDPRKLKLQTILWVLFDFISGSSAGSATAAIDSRPAMQPPRELASSNRIPSGPTLKTCLAGKIGYARSGCPLHEKGRLSLRLRRPWGPATEVLTRTGSADVSYALETPSEE